MRAVVGVVFSQFVVVERRIWLRASGPTLALSKPIALAIHFEDVDVMGEGVQQGAGEPLGAKDAKSIRRTAGCWSRWWLRARNAG